MDLSNIMGPPPERDDEPEAQRWRGSLFWGGVSLNSNFMWRNGVTYDHLKKPG